MKYFSFLLSSFLSLPFFLLSGQGLAVQPVQVWNLCLFFLSLQSVGDIGILCCAWLNYDVIFLWTKHRLGGLKQYILPIGSHS